MSLTIKGWTYRLIQKHAVALDRYDRACRLMWGWLVASFFAAMLTIAWLIWDGAWMWPLAGAAFAAMIAFGYHETRTGQLEEAEACKRDLAEGTFSALDESDFKQPDVLVVEADNPLVSDETPSPGA